MTTIYDAAILLVDDNPDLLTLVTDNLSTAGYKTVCTAADCAAARAAFAAHRPDLMILDINLPDGDGFGLFRTLRTESEPQSRGNTGESDAAPRSAWKNGVTEGGRQSQLLFSAYKGKENSTSPLTFGGWCCVVSPVVCCSLSYPLCDSGFSCARRRS